MSDKTTAMVGVSSTHSVDGDMIVRGLTLVEESVANLEQKLKEAEEKVKKAEATCMQAEKRATKWERRYTGLKDNHNIKEEEVDSDNEQQQQQSHSTRAKRKSESGEDDQSDKDKKIRLEPKEEHEEEGDEDLSVETDESTETESIQVGADKFDSLDDTTKKWIKALGLKNSYGTRNEGLNQVRIKDYVPPYSFEAIFRLTDFLFPVDQGDKTYHKRLFEDHRRPGWPVRNALRDAKKRHPEDPLVSWHKKGQQWIPPTASALTIMVQFILDM